MENLTQQEFKALIEILNKERRFCEKQSSISYQKESEFLYELALKLESICEIRKN